MGRNAKERRIIKCKQLNEKVIAGKKQEGKEKG